MTDPTPAQIEAAARAICLHYHGNQNNTTAEYNTLTIGWEKFTDQAKAALIAGGDV